MNLGSPVENDMPVTAPEVANPCGYFVVSAKMSLGLAPKSTSRVELNLKNPPSTGLWMKSTPPFRVCLPTVFEKSSRNCHFRWNDCCGTLPLVPNCALGKVI